MEDSDSSPSWSDVEPSNPELQQLWAQLSTMEIRNGILYRQFQRPDGTIRYYQLIVPLGLRTAVLEQVHSDVASGHFGMLKTSMKLQKSAYRYGWKRDVEVFVRRCNVCCRYRHGARHKQGPLQFSPTSTVMQKMHIDLTGPHVRSKMGMSTSLPLFAIFHSI